MRKAVAILLVAILCGIAFAFGSVGTQQEETEKYLRVHIRANSNSEADQAVKYLVRDNVVDFLTPIVAGCETKAEAMSELDGRLQEIARAAEDTLLENGFLYGAAASLKEENFPARVYEGITLPSSVYDALIIELGAGEGDNWWCVVYPPLCFVNGSQEIVYKSKIAEIIKNFFGS